MRVQVIFQRLGGLVDQAAVKIAGEVRVADAQAALAFDAALDEEKRHCQASQTTVFGQRFEGGEAVTECAM